MGMIPLGYVQLTNLGTAKTLGTIPKNALWAVLTAEGAAVRFRDDGTAPTATVGQLITTTDPPFTYTGQLGNVQVIGTAGGAILNVSLYGTTKQTP
jgi:hypothetical protein